MPIFVAHDVHTLNFMSKLFPPISVIEQILYIGRDQIIPKASSYFHNVVDSGSVHRTITLTTHVPLFRPIVQQSQRLQLPSQFAQ